MNAVSTEFSFVADEWPVINCSFEDNFQILESEKSQAEGKYQQIRSNEIEVKSYNNPTKIKYGSSISWPSYNRRSGGVITPNKKIRSSGVIPPTKKIRSGGVIPPSRNIRSSGVIPLNKTIRSGGVIPPNSNNKYWLSNKKTFKQSDLDESNNQSIDNKSSNTNTDSNMKYKSDDYPCDQYGKSWYNRFFLLADNCEVNSDEITEQEILIHESNRYKFTSDQKKYLKNARRRNLKKKTRQMIAGPIKTYSNMNNACIEVAKEVTHTVANITSHHADHLQCGSPDRNIIPCELETSSTSTNDKQIMGCEYLPHEEISNLTIFQIKLGCLNLQLNWPDSTISLNTLKKEIYQTLNIHAPYSVYINKRAVHEECIISSTDIIEVIISGSGGGRKKQNSLVHPEYPCTCCSICLKYKEGEYFFHLDIYQQSEGKTDFIQFIQKENCNIQMDDCICKSCKIKLEKKFKETNCDEPMCKKRKTCTPCIISKIPTLSCTNMAIIDSSFITLDDIWKCYEVAKENIPLIETDDIKFCRAHYYNVWQFCNVKICTICDIQINFKSLDSERKSVCYFDEKCIKVNCFDGIQTNSPVCLSCYNKFIKSAAVLQIQKIASQHNDPGEIIDAINKLPCLDTNSEEVNEEWDLIILIFNYMLNKLQAKGAILLKDIHVFCNSIPLKSANIGIDAETLLNLITFNFGKLINNITNKNKDTLLLWHDADMSECLHIALSDIFQESVTCKSSHTNNHDAKCLEEACSILRNRLIKVDQQYISEPDLTQINVNNMVLKEMDPLLWNFFFKLTITNAEQQYLIDRKFNWNEILNDQVYTNRQTQTAHTMSRLSLISSCIYHINKRTYFPLPLLFSDIIDKYTKSSSDCLQLFNMFGICTSYESLKRHQIKIATSRMNTKPSSLLNKESFTYVSVDNVSFWASNARVRSTDTERGLNCTSYMSCQPKPQSAILTTEEMCSITSEIFCDEHKQEFKCFNINYQGNDSFFLSCLFNIDHQLQICSRDEMGKPKSSTDIIREAGILTSFKNSILNELQTNINYFESLSDNYFKQWIADNNLSCYIDRFKEVFDKDIDLPCALPEMMAAAHISGNGINIFQKEGEIIKIRHIIPGSTKYTKPLNVLEYSNKNDNSKSYQPLISNQDTTQAVLLKYKNVDFKSNFNNSSTYRSQFGQTPGEAVLTKTKSKTKERAFNNSSALYPTLTMSISDMELSCNTNENNINGITFCEIESMESDNQPAYNQIKLDIFSYMISKYAASKTGNTNLPGIKVFMSKQDKNTTEESAYMYLDIINENADCKETMENVLCKLYKIMEINSHIKYLVVVGDGKTYDHLVKIKSEYGDSLKWLLPFPGDWHTLKNFAYVLLKIYGPCGLHDLIKIFHKGKTANSIIQATSWDKTHNFLLQVFEATFRYQIDLYIKYRKDSLPVNTTSTKNDLLIDNITKKIIPLLQFHTDDDDMYQNLRDTLEEFNILVKENYDDFHSFLCKVSEENVDFKFWHNFVHRDCILYVSLYLAIRSGNWSLRNSALYKIAHFFQVSESKYYFRLLPIHLSDLLKFPQHILNQFKKGAFASNITGSNWSSLALDEMHEMTINKDIKVAFTTPSENNVKAKLLYLPYRSMAHKSIMTQLNPGRHKQKQKEDSKQFNKDLETNIMVYLSELQKSNCSLSQVILDNNITSKSSLQHMFNETSANDIQRDDLLGFYELGKKEFEEYCKVFITKENTSFSGNNKPRKIKKINNFQLTTRNKYQEQKQIVKVHKDMIEVKNLQIAWANAHNIAPGEIHNFVCYPAAISNHDLTPYKGLKATAKTFFHKHYPECFTIGTIDIDITCIVIDAMFILHSSPAPSNSTFEEHIKRLYTSWVLNWFAKYQTLIEIHLVFDQFSDEITPKIFERSRRNKGFANGDKLNISDSTLVPHGKKWQEFISNRDNKFNFIKYIISKCKKYGSDLKENHTIIIDGNNEVIQITQSEICGLSAYENNHTEADTKVWLHAHKTQFNDIIIFSPDNDIYNIGFGLLNDFSDKTIWVQTKKHPYESEFLNVRKVAEKSSTSVYMNTLSLEKIGHMLQMLFIVTGSDYTSYFKHQGKNSLYKTFFHNFNFINQNDITLDEIINGSFNKGFLSFGVLIGCQYFNGCSNFYAKINPDKTAQSYFKHLNNSNSAMNAKTLSNWLDGIRKATIELKKSEEFYLPSNGSLLLHWKRCCWVGQVWQQSTNNIIQYPDVSQWGWKYDENNDLAIMWDSQANIDKIDTTLKLWTKGCSCKSGCKNRRCGCRNREGRSCGPGCSCKGLCANAPSDPNLAKLIENILAKEIDSEPANPVSNITELDIEINSDSDDGDNSISENDSESDNDEWFESLHI